MNMTRRFPSSLRARLLALVLLALVPALGMILLSAAEQRRHAADNAMEDALRLARLAAYEQAELLESARELLGTVAQLRTIREDGPETCRTLLRRVLEQRSHYATLFAASVPQGTVFCATLADVAPHSVAERPYFRRVVETRRFTVGDYQVNRTTGQPNLVLAHPVFGDSGRLEAIVAASLELRWLNRLASELPFATGTAVTVTDRHGTIIGRHPDPEAWLGRPLSDLPAFRGRLPLGGEGTFQAVGFDGRQRLFAVAPLSAEPELAGFSVITGVPADTALAAADRALRRNLVGLGLVTALVVLTAWAASGALVLRPVARLLAATRRLGAGDLAARTGAMSGATEIDDLGRAFDEMAEALQQDTAARKGMAEELERRRQEAETLLTVAQSVGSTLDLTETMRRLARELGRHLKADMVGAYVPTPDGTALRPLAGYHVPKPRLEAFRDYRIPLKGHPFLVEAWEQQRPVFSSDVPTDLRIDREAVARFPHQSLLVVPLIHEGELLGGLGVVWWRERRALTPDEFRLADGIGRQAALTIASARLHEETRRRLAEVTTVARVARAVNSTLRLEAVFQTVVDEISAAFAYQRVSIYLLGGDALRLQASVGYATTIGVIPIDQGMSGRVARTGRAELMRDATRDPEFLAAEPDIRQAVIVPLKTRDGRVLGTLAVESSGEPELTENDLGLMELLADQVAVAVANAGLYDETARGQREAEAVARLARTLTETLDVTALAGRVVQEMLPLLGVSFARLRLLQPDGSLRTVPRADPGGVHSDSDSVLPSGAGLSARVVAEGRAAISRDVLGEAGIALPDALRREIEASGYRAMITVPLRVQGTVIGVLSVADRVGREFSEREVTLLQAVADQAALALDNARLFAEADQRRRAAESLAEVARLVSQSLEPEEVALWIADGIRRLLGALAATLYRLEPESGDLVALGVSNAPELEDVSGRNVVLPRGTGLSAVAIREGRAVTTRDILSDPRVVFTPEAKARTERSPFRAALAVPIHGGGKAIGTLAVGDRAGRIFGEEDLRLAEAFADRAAVALDNARLYEAAEQRRREAEVLAELARSVGASLDLDTVLQRVVEGAKELCQSDVGEIALWEAASSAMVFRYWAGVSSTAYRAIRVEPGKGVGGQVILTERPFRTDNYAEDPRITKDYVGPVSEEGVARLLSVPIRMGDRVEGLLNVANRTVMRRFTDDDEAILVKLADQAAVAIGNARLYAEAERRRRMAESLAEVGRLLSESLDFEEVAQRIVDSVRTLLGAVAAGVVRLEPGSGDLVAVATSGKVGIRRGSTLVFPEGTGLVGLAVSERRPVVTADLLADPRVRLTPEARARVEQTPSRAALAVPLVVKNRVIGAFGVGDRLGRVFDIEEIRIAQAFADQAALALENARLFERQLDLLRDTQRQHQEAVALEAVARQLASSLDREEVLQRIVDSARGLCRAEFGFLAPYDPETDTATVVVASGARSDVLVGARLARGRGMGGKVIETGEAFVTEDYLHDPRFTKDYADVAAQEGITAQAVVPLQVKGATTGLLCVANRTHRPFVAEDVAVLAKFADQAAIGLENSRLYAERQRAEAELQVRARQQAAVAELGQRALAETDLDAIMDTVVRVVAETLGVEFCKILELLPDGTALRLRAAVGWRDGLVGRETIGTGFDSQAGYTLLSGGPVVVEDLRTEMRFSGAALLRDHGVVSGMSVVIRAPSRPFGVLGAHTARQRTFGRDDVHFLQAAAHVLAAAIQRGHAEESLRRHAERLTVLHEIDQAIVAARSPQEIAQAALRRLRQQVPCQRASVTLFDFEAGELTTLAVDVGGPTGLPSATRAPLKEYAGDLEAMRAGTVWGIEDLASIAELAPALRILLTEGIRSLIGVPLLTQGTLVGALNLSADAPGAFTPAHIEIARELANSLAVAIQDARLFEQVRDGRERLQTLSRRLVEVQEAERRHVARELHDEIGQVLTGLKLSLEMSSRTPGSLDEAQKLVQDLIARVRDMSLELRPAMLDDLGLLPTLLWHFERYSGQTGVRVEFEHGGLERRFPPDVETAAYRIVQEALTNVARHAGAPEVTVWIWAHDNALNVHVEDRGRGFDSESTSAAGGGLSGMRERAGLLGGHLTLDSRPGTGTRITAGFPLEGPLEQRRIGR